MNTSMKVVFGDLPSLQPQRGFRLDEPRDLPPDYSLSIKAFPALYLERNDLESGNKVLLPPSVLEYLSKYVIPQPIMFSVQNPLLGNSTNVGILEFTAEEDSIIMPNWLFDQLNMEFGIEVQIQLLLGAPQGRFMKLQPHKTEFTRLSDPKTVLEKSLSNFVCVTEGDTIVIEALDKSYSFNVLEVRPKVQSNCICIIDTNVQVDLMPPLDYVKKSWEAEEKKEEDDDNNIDDKRERNYFNGKGVNLNGEEVFEGFSKKISDDIYDPRKHRISGGVKASVENKQFVELGIKQGENKSPLANNKGSEKEIEALKHIIEKIRQKNS